jgi:hypothetical protein
MSTTYVAQDTCPESCPLRNEGCYAETGWAGLQTYRINTVQKALRWSVTKLAQVEAMMIGRLTGTRRLRAHVVGDCSTVMGARHVGGALRRHEAKHGMRAWTYTHAWREVHALDWAGARVLASCGTVGELQEAHDRMYAATVIIPRTESRKAYQSGGFTIIPCPAQFKDARTGQRQTTCERCNLCSDTKRNWARKRVVGFQPDGQTMPLERTGKLVFGEAVVL